MIFDAIKLPDSVRTGETMKDRLDSVLDIAEPLLGVDRSKGDRAYMRWLKTERTLFVTRSPDDTLLWPISHRLAQQPRYKWTDYPAIEGAKVGMLRTEAETEAAMGRPARSPQALERFVTLSLRPSLNESESVELADLRIVLAESYGDR